MNLDLSEEQEMLRDMVRGVCEEYSPMDKVRELEDDATGFPADLWKQFAEVGLCGILIPEIHGGSDQTILDSAVVYEELGRSLAPSPHFVSCVLAARTLQSAGSEEQQAEWLPKIASGEAILTPAWLEPKNSHGPKGVQMRAVRDGDDYVIDGTKLHVLFGGAATRLLLLVRCGDGLEDIDLLLVDPKSKGVTLTQQMSLASDTQYEVDFSAVRVPVSDRVGAPGSGWATWNEVMHDGIILQAAQAAGGAARALELTVEYARERKQFDKPLGAFQALAHYLADAATNVEGGQTLVYEAAWARSEGKDISRLAPMAKLFMCQTYRDVTAMCLQVWGGVGFTIEYDAQLYFRRAKQLEVSWWDTHYLEELVASSVLDSNT